MSMVLLFCKPGLMVCPTHGLTLHRLLDDEWVCAACMKEQIERNVDCLR